MKVATAFASGCRGRIEMGAKLHAGPAAFWGITARSAPLIRQTIAEGRDWIYLDHCYLGERQRHYRATRGAYQHSGIGEGDALRLAGLGVTVHRWRVDRPSNFVLVCPPGELMCDLRDWEPPDVWLDRVVTTLRAHTDRPIIVRPKPLRSGAVLPFRHAIKGAHAVVTHISNVAIEAIMGGVPAFVTGECAAMPVAETDLTKIETPRMSGKRRTWAATLALNQWTLYEIKTGVCARALGVR